jgi:hypothetical protein
MNPVKAVKQFVTNPAQVRKALVALVACIGIAVAKGVVPEVVGTYLTVLQPLLVAYGVWKVPNAEEEA